MPATDLLPTNKTAQILAKAEKEGYGVIAAIAYNIEQILALVKAAENTRSPLILQFFPWAITFSNGLLIHSAAIAAKAATVPISIHLDHCQDKDMVRHAADNLPFDSIMVDMSHYEKEENLRLTKELVAYCHEREISTEAEPGRIEGGEDGIADTADLSGLLTTPEEIEEFVDTGVDFLAPAFGNVHGEYGKRGPVLEYDRLESIYRDCKKRGVRVVLHGTNDFPEDIMTKCIKGGCSKINVNKLVLDDYNNYMKEAAPTTLITKLMEEGVEKVVKLTELWMHRCGSAGKA
ncbi:putative fructose-bisphosphate aldolase [Pseudocercospora fuligena]|uniref:Fructose-bisphosphate aldolase n=1 Tax=Pseudocercospora fuligena TaxID=685502 RepID=A0A8H6RA23_9PEZI|nr:putative fructose-bisphosphate aldolase [Pseudocercospora fuligena]